MRLSLSAKFTFAIMAILAATMAVNALYYLHASSRFHEEQLIERARSLGRLISLVSPDAILGFDILLLNDYTRQLASQRDIVYGVIVNANDVPISSYVDDSDPAIKLRLKQSTSKDIREVLSVLDATDQLIRLEFPITHNDAQLGRFLVGLNKQTLQAEFKQQLIIQLLMFTLIVLFLSAAIHWVFRINFLHPIRSLISASRRVAAVNTQGSKSSRTTNWASLRMPST